MRIKELHPEFNGLLSIVADDGRFGYFNINPYLEYEAFAVLKNHEEFTKIFNGGYFVEWDCGADLSADTIEARWQITNNNV